MHPSGVYIVFSSDEDLPLSPGQEDRRKVRKRDTQPLSQPGLIDGPATEPTPGERPVETKTDSPMDKPPEAELPAWSDTEIMPLIIIDKSSVVEKLTTTDRFGNFVTPVPGNGQFRLPGRSVSSPVAKSGEEGPFTRYASRRKHI